MGHCYGNHAVFESVSPAVTLIGVDDLGVFVLQNPGNMGAVVHMHMSVYHIFGRVPAHQLRKAQKSPVGGRIPVSQIQSRRMGEKDVKSAVFVQLKGKPANPAPHVFLPYTCNARPGT